MKDLVSKVREDMVGDPSKVFEHKAILGKTKICKSAKVCRLIVGMVARPVYLYSMSHSTPADVETRYKFNAELQSFKAPQIKPGSLQIFISSYLKQNE